jgi:hypothetical protein
MVFVLAWTIGDAPSLSCQSLHQAQFVCSMSSGIITFPWLDTVIRCGTTEKVAMKPPHSIDFLPSPFATTYV